MMLEIEQFTVPLRSPLETASGRIERREGFLVYIDYEGTGGVGEATPLTGWTESLGECRTALGRARAVAEELDWGIALAKTDAPAARHGLALALAEARARAAGQPLYRHMSDDRFVPSVPVNATIGDQSAEKTADAAPRAVHDGFDCLKCKAGARSVSEDIERVRAVRERVGDGIELRVDANGSWTLEQASEAIEAFEAIGVSYVEQPLPAEDLAGHTKLRGGPVDIALDEGLLEVERMFVVGHGGTGWFGAQRYRFKQISRPRRGMAIILGAAVCGHTKFSRRMSPTEPTYGVRERASSVTVGVRRAVSVSVPTRFRGLSHRPPQLPRYACRPARAPCLYRWRSDFRAPRLR
jgi:O-succinylbenzoate synthase